MRWALAAVFAAIAIVTLGSGYAATQQAQKKSLAEYDKLPDGAYSVVAEIRAKPGKENELRLVTLPLVAEVRREPNNLIYFLHEDLETPGHFIFYEVFASQADFDAHNKTPPVQAWFAKLPELAEGGVRVSRIKILGNKESSESK